MGWRLNWLMGLTEKSKSMSLHASSKASVWCAKNMYTISLKNLIIKDDQ